MARGGRRPNTGGRRPGAGKPKGYKAQKTLEKEAARELVRQLVTAELTPMVEAQIQNAKGLRHTFLRDEKNQRFVRLTSPEQIEQALNSGDEGRYYWTYTKDPSTNAFDSLLNRALDRPKEQPQDVHVSLTSIEARRKALTAAQQRAANALIAKP